jgi:murein DD-endopeptidase MepM/ murein hydrolase activator NlpD
MSAGYPHLWVKFAPLERGAAKLVLGIPVNISDASSALSRGRNQRIRLRIAAIVGASTFLVAGSFLANSVPPAYATTYPTWADVVAARNSEAATKAEVAQIQSALASLNSQLTTANAAATATGLAAEVASQKYTVAEDKQQTLESQEKAAAARATKSKQEIAGYASQLARGPSGAGGWSTMSLLLNGKSEGQLLNNLGAIGQVSKQENALLEKALSDENSVKQLTALATAQSQILAVQKKAADDAKAKAVAAATTLQAAVTAEAAHQQALSVELAALTTNANMTYTQYQAGVAAAGGAGQAGVVDAQGWALPTAGRITSPWGYRYDPAQDYRWAMHYGDDIADGCLKPIYAATAGTVTYAGIYGDYGYYIAISHGGGISTAYGHIAKGETFVHVGQSVQAGQNIARTGSTGASTGCHLYFAVSVNGSWTDPVPFMRARGITIG